MPIPAPRRGHARALAIVASGVVLLGPLPGQAAAAAVPVRNTFDFQCFQDSSSGKVRVWWVENRSRNVLKGDDRGVASDGRCATVPASVPWMAGQVETVMRDIAAAGLPMTRSDKGVQRRVQGPFRASDDGSGAFDVFLDGGSEAATAAFAQCQGYVFYRGRAQRFGSFSKMYVYDVPATVPDDTWALGIRNTLAHELVHAAQCAVTNARRLSTGSDLQGPWVEAVPNAYAAGLVGGYTTVDRCDDDTALLSASGRRMVDGYGQWPFWSSLLSQRPGRAYIDLLRDVLRGPAAKADQLLTRALRQRFTDRQIGQALLTWMTTYYLDSTRPSASGAPITWTPGYLTEGDIDPALALRPPAGGTASSAVTMRPLTCAALMVSWPDGAENLSVSATGSPSGDPRDVMAAGVDVAPGSPPTASCGTESQRTPVSPVGGQFIATRPCIARDGSPQMWVLVVNGTDAPIELTVTATAS